MRIKKCIAHVSMFTYHDAVTVAALRMEKDNIFNRQTFAIKNCANYKVQKIPQIQEVAFDLRYETSGRSLLMPSTTSHSSYHISTDLWFAWHFSRTQFDITNRKAVVHYKRARKYVSNGLLIGDV